MKTYLNDQLTTTVRQAETFKTPKNIILQSLLFLFVFLLMQIAQGIALAPVLLPELQNVKSAQDVFLLLNSSKLITAMLYSTIPPTLICFLFCKFGEKRNFSTMGLYRENAGKQYMIGLGIGFVLFSCVVGIAILLGGVKFEGFQTLSPMLLILLIGYGFQGMNEEVIYRGYFMTTIMRHHNLWWAVGLNAFFFGYAHSSNQGFSLFAMINLMLYAIMISFYMIRTNSLLGACAIHSIWNFVQGNFYGLPVSGAYSGDSVFRMSLTGSELINGGDFGLEAGLPTTIVMIAVICILLFVPFPRDKTTTNDT